MPVCYLYERWSTEAQTEGDSARRQRAAAERYVAQNPGLTLDLTTRWRDAGVSAFKGQGLEQTALVAFAEAVKSKRIAKGSYLLLESADRLSRRAPLKALAALERLTMLGVYVVTLSDGKRYDAQSFEREDVTDLVTALLHAHRSYAESAVKSRRVREALKAKRTRAQEVQTPLGMICPSWLRLDKDRSRYVVVPTLARIVRRVFDLTASGLGNTQVAKRLNREGVKVISGRAEAWSAGGVGQLVTNRAVLGEYAPHRTVIDPETGKRSRVPDGEPVPNQYPSIIPAALFLRVQRERQQRRNPSGPRRERVSNLFTGLLRCQCGGRIHLLAHRPHYGYLTCAARIGGSKCRMAAFPYAKTEALLLALLQRVIDWRKVLPQEREQHQTAVERLEEELASLQVEHDSTRLRLARLVDAVETGAKVEALTDRITSLEALLRTQGERQEDMRGELGQEKARLRSAKETVQARRAAFEAWEAKKNSPDSRVRLAQVLRDMVSKIVLSGERGSRGLVLVFANGEDYRFLVSPDCRTASDPHDGEVVVTSPSA